MPLGYAPSNPGPIGSAATGLGTGFSQENIQEQQLKKLLMQAQAFQAIQPMTQQIGQEVNQNPQMAQNQQLIAQLQRLYRGTGMQAPISPVVPAQPGVTQTGTFQGEGDASGMQATSWAKQPTPASGGIDASILTGNTFYQWYAKNADRLRPLTFDQRIAEAQAAGVPVGQRERTLMQSVPTIADPKLAETRDKDIETSFDRQLKPALPRGSAAINAAVHNAEAQARAAGWDDDRIQNTFGPYLEQGVAAMSPMEIAKLNKTTAQTDEIRALIQPRVDEINSITARNKAQVQHLRDLQNNFDRMFGLKAGLMGADTKKALAQAADAVEDGNMKQQEADFYGARTAEIANSRYTNPQEWTAAYKATTDAIDNSNAIVQKDYAVIAGLQNSLNYMTQQGKTAAGDTITKIQADIQKQGDRQNALKQQLSGLMGQSPFGGQLPQYVPQQNSGSPQALGPIVGYDPEGNPVYKVNGAVVYSDMRPYVPK